MDRVTEPELMNDEEHARAYAGIDFGAPHQNFITLFQQTFADRQIEGFALDLGCGPGDITRRFARAFRQCIVHGVDGAPAMLHYGHQITAQDPATRERVKLVLGRLPGATLPRSHYDVVISNSLLHHLPDPHVLWQSIRQYTAPGALVFVMDLRRPASCDEAKALVELHAANDPDVFKLDFYHSLLAAFTPDEIRDQLRQAGLDYFQVRSETDRHVMIAGVMR